MKKKWVWIMAVMAVLSINKVDMPVEAAAVTMQTINRDAAKNTGEQQAKKSGFEEWVAEITAPTQAASWPDETPTEIKTPLGKLKGMSHGDILIFRGIPYAEAPVGERRFAPPEKVHAWSGVKDASKFGPMSYQAGQGNFSEDCLSLNVWTPAKATKEKLPVYVFIHGGGMVLGSGAQSLYEGTEMAKSGIVVVTINYRLNTLGFMPLNTTYKKYGTTGNWGLLDMICALQWVQDNVGTFGGDPKRVTIGGESAGSVAVSALISSPKAKGLFQQAIMESGALTSAKAVAPITGVSLEKSMKISEYFAEKFGADDSETGLERLRQVPPKAILDASLSFKETRPPQVNTFWPISDGFVLPYNLVQKVEKGNINRVKLLAGFNTNEASIFANPNITEDDYKVLVNNIFGEKAQEVLTRYPVNDQYNAWHRYTDLATMAILRSGTYLYADSLAKLGEDVYMYQFSFVDPALKNTGFGAAHGSELRYVFHNNMQYINQDEQAKRVAAQVYNAWTNFIKTGNPNKGNSLGTGIKWENYTAQNRVELRISEKSVMEPLDKIADVDFINQMMHSDGQ